MATFAAAPLVGSAAALAESRIADEAPATFKDLDPKQKMRERRFPNVELVTHEGRRVRLYDDLIRGKKVVISFMYATCKGICVPVTANLVRVQKLLGDRVGKDIFFRSFTLKPDEDTPEKLAEYASLHGVGPGWDFVTGDPDDLERLRRSLGFVDPDPEVDRDKSNHAGNVLFGNEPLMLWAACPGQVEAGALARSILRQVDRPVRTT